MFVARDWYFSYRGLLDAWKMWNQRAHFDIAMRTSTNEKPHQQVYISCNFCGKSISAVMQGLSRARGPFGRLASTSNKLKVNVILKKWKKKLAIENYSEKLKQYFLIRCLRVRAVENHCHVALFA